MPVHKSKNVFVNCPFDDAYKPFFNSIVFTIFRCGFTPRCALEVVDTAGTRISKIESIISECPLGIHDISRTELDERSGYPRFNMPFELGLYLGAKRYGPTPHNRKRCIVLDTEQYRYQKFLSDISGQDISAHHGRKPELVDRVRNFLNASIKGPPLPGTQSILGDESAFYDRMPLICRSLDLDPEDLVYADFVWLVADFLSD